MRTIRLLPLLAVAVAFAGCAMERPPEAKPINSYLAERADLANVRRIMVLPFAHESGVSADCTKVRDAFVADLQKLRRFEVVPLPGDGHLLARSGHVLWETLESWLPPVLGLA